MKAPLLVLSITLSLSAIAQEQQSVVIGSYTERPNALLIVNPQENDQGVLLPQLTTEERMRMRPSSPYEDGLLVYDRTMNGYFYWSTGGWLRLGTDAASRTSYRSVDPLHFRALKNDNDGRHNNLMVFDRDDAFVAIRDNNMGRHIAAPLDLPHGAVLDALTIHYMDNHPQGIEVRLIRKRVGGESREIGHWRSSRKTATIERATLTPSEDTVIDLEHYTYRVMVSFNYVGNEIVDTPDAARQRLYGIAVTYRE